MKVKIVCGANYWDMPMIKIRNYHTPKKQAFYTIINDAINKTIKVFLLKIKVAKLNKLFRGK